MGGRHLCKKIRVIQADDHAVILQGLPGQEDGLQMVALLQDGDELLEGVENLRRTGWC